jgi:dTDP-4-amino-4,6-dideoxygalactose transaminase
MYIPDTFYCLSFHYKKLLPIGRGGMILTNDSEAVEWLKMARFDGRKEIPLYKDNATIIGYNMYLTPEQAARGLALFDTVKNKNLVDLDVKEQNYPDLSEWRCFKNE